jgi:Domain of unknown function (DUF4158)
VPTNFLSPEQISRCARYNADPTPEDLGEFSHLKDDQPQLETCRLSHTTLGMAVAICTLRHLNAFLADPTDVPIIMGSDNLPCQKYRQRREYFESWRISTLKWLHIDLLGGVLLRVFSERSG